MFWSTFSWFKVQTWRCWQYVCNISSIDSLIHAGCDWFMLIDCFSPGDWVFEGLEGETSDAPASPDKEETAREETEMSPDLEVQFWGKTHEKNTWKMDQKWSNSSSDRIIQFCFTWRWYAELQSLLSLLDPLGLKNRKWKPGAASNFTSSFLGVPKTLKSCQTYHERSTRFYKQINRTLKGVTWVQDFTDRYVTMVWPKLGITLTSFSYFDRKPLPSWWPRWCKHRRSLTWKCSWWSRV